MSSTSQNKKSEQSKKFDRSQMINISNWSFVYLKTHVRDAIETISRNYDYDKIQITNAGWTIIDPNNVSEEILKEWLLKHFPTSYYIN